MLDIIIEIGHDVTATKRYIWATATILFYDYLLTLPDEIEYVWAGERSWIFWVFVLIRYLPMTHLLWGFASSNDSNPNTKVCEQTFWYPLFTYVISVFLVQAMVSLRVYAVTMGNIPICIGFGTITVSQFGLGIFLVIVAVKGGAQALPQIPFDAYRLCAPSRHRPIEIAYTGISLVYELLAFLLIILLANASKIQGSGIPGILKTIAIDATWYFLVIFSSHFTFMMTLLFAPIGLQFLPAPGTAVYLSVMISRIMFSLRKSVDPQQGGRPTEEPIVGGNLQSTIRFLRPWRGTNEEGDDIPLDVRSQP